MASRGAGRTLLAGPPGKSVITGASVAFDLLVAGFQARNLPHLVIDVSPGGSVARAGAFTVGRAMATLAMLCAFVAHLPWCSRVYVTISCSRLGFVRDLLMVWPARLLRRRVTLHFHGGGYADFLAQQPAWLRRLIRATLRQADTVIVLGEGLRSQFDFLGGAATRIRVVPNGVSPDLRPEGDAAKQLPESGPIRILYLSNMMESKGYLDLLSACRLLRYERHLSIHCDFCGEFVRTTVDENRWTAGEAHRNFTRLVHEWGLEEVVTYHGTVNGEAKREMLRQAHLLALPTYYAWEGQPICILEALAFATPVVSTRHRAIPEQVRDGHNGVLVQCAAPREVADAVERVCHDPEGYAELSRNARETYREYATPEMHLGRLIAAIFGEGEDPVAAGAAAGPCGHPEAAP